MAICWTLGITILSLISLTNIISFSFIAGKDKYVHFLFYLLFTFLWGIALNSTELKRSISILVSAILYGILIEIAQGLFTVNRQPDFFDVIANSCGALVGWLALTYYFKHNKLGQ